MFPFLWFLLVNLLWCMPLFKPVKALIFQTLLHLKRPIPIWTGWDRKVALQRIGVKLGYSLWLFVVHFFTAVVCLQVYCSPSSFRHIVLLLLLCACVCVCVLVCVCTQIFMTTGWLVRRLLGWLVFVFAGRCGCCRNRRWLADLESDFTLHVPRCTLWRHLPGTDDGVDTLTKNFW